MKGLAAWLREESQRRLFQSERRHISTSDHRRSRQVDFVFDLHALALYVHRSAGLDRSKGGDYAELSIAARAVFRTIQHVGVRPVVVASGWRIERNGLSFDPEVIDLRSDAVDDKFAARILRREAHYFAMDAACRPVEAAARKNSGGNPSWNSNKTVMPLFGEQIIRDVAEQEGVEVLEPCDGDEFLGRCDRLAVSVGREHRELVERLATATERQKEDATAAHRLAIDADAEMQALQGKCESTAAQLQELEAKVTEWRAPLAKTMADLRDTQAAHAYVQALHQLGELTREYDALPPAPGAETAAKVAIVEQLAALASTVGAKRGGSAAVVSVLEALNVRGGRLRGSLEAALASSLNEGNWPKEPARRLTGSEGDVYGVPQKLVDVQLGRNTIAPSYLSLEEACEVMVSNMCATRTLMKFENGQTATLEMGGYPGAVYGPSPWTHRVLGTKGEVRIVGSSVLLYNEDNSDGYEHCPHHKCYII